MSRAFLNEDKFEQANDEVVERPVSSHPNYVTPDGLRHLQQEAERLRLICLDLEDKKEDPFALQKKAEVERDLRYFSARLDSAVLVNPARQKADQVLFGATVNAEDEEGNSFEFTIVGEDEADVSHNKVSWVSPLASALIGSRVGDLVKWRRPVGDMGLEVVSIRYMQ